MSEATIERAVTPQPKAGEQRFLRVLVTPQLHAAIGEASSADGCSIADYVRRSVIHQLEADGLRRSAAA